MRGEEALEVMRVEGGRKHKKKRRYKRKKRLEGSNDEKNVGLTKERRVYRGKRKKKKEKNEIEYMRKPGL